MKKSKKSVIVLIFVFFAGLSLLLYPSVANYWNSSHTTSAIASYAMEVSGMDDEEVLRMFQDALDYNQALAARGTSYNLTEKERVLYNSLLDVSSTGIMGYIEIPILRVSLPIYHGTDEGVLQIAVGHLDWSSLPVGGESSSCVLCGHRGLPSSKLFTDLDKLEEGDIFMISVLNRVLTYEVDQIRIVEPDDIKDLEIVDGMDYCTLETCTPYAINTHRILVRGHRIENAAEARFVQVTADAVMIEPLLVAPALFVGLLLILLIVIAFTPRGGNRNEEDRYEEK
ncbi:MAG: class C sortase [Clostridia bacterium]|nr:class C sortase [Clostridia bacterium]